MDTIDFYKHVITKYNVFKAKIREDVSLGEAKVIGGRIFPLAWVHGPEITDFPSFFVYLHELGHLATYRQHPKVFNNHEHEVLAWRWALEVLKKEKMRLPYVGAYLIRICLGGYIGWDKIKVEFQNNNPFYQLHQLKECKHLLNKLMPEEE